MNLRSLLVVFACLLLTSVSQASESNYAFDDPEQRKVFLELTAELRCPMCQNQNIADSDAMIAHDMRRKVYQLLQEGKSQQEVIEFMRARYGDFVHYQPPVTPATSLLWLVPIGFVLFGGVAFVVKRFFSSPVTVNPENEKSEQVALAEAEKLLEEDSKS